MSHAHDKTKSISLYFFTELKTYHLSYSTYKLDPVSRVTGIPGWYWILGIKCSDTTGVGLVY